MKVSQRSVRSAAGLVVALAAAVVPAVAGAQRTQVPGPDTKRVLISTFRGDKEGGVRTADEIRNRVAGDFNIKTLMPNSKKDIDATLQSSGYPPDSALSPSDIRELAKLLRSDEVIDGQVTRTGGGYQVNARMFLPRDVSLSQPLLTVVTNNLGDMAKQVVHEYDESRKQLPATQDCENAIRDGNLAAAKDAARRGIAAYPKATLARLCLAGAFQAQKTTADSTGPWKDSVIAITTQIVALDKSSRIAYQLQVDAYSAKADTVNWVKALLAYMESDPSSAAKEKVVIEIVNMHKAALAVPIVKQLVVENAGDPTYAKLNWQVLRAASLYKESVPAGEAWVALDSSAADSGYFFRQISDLATDSAYQKAAEFAARGSKHFPTSGTLLFLEAQNERKAGQLPAAKATLDRLTVVDPKFSGANLLKAQICFDLGDIACSIASMKADVAADPTNKERDAAFLLSLGNQEYRIANGTKKPEDFQKAVALLQASDAINPSANAQFLLGVSAFNLLQLSVADLQKSKSCSDAKVSGDYLALVNTGMMKGGSVMPDNAKQILGALDQYRPFVDGSIKKYCK